VQQVVLYLVTAVIFLGADAVWLQAYISGVFRRNLGDMMREDFLVAPAAGFYALYVVGMLYFCSAGGLADKPLWRIALDGALLGFFCYGTFELTSYSIMRNWAVEMVVADILWGTAATAVSAVLGVVIVRAIFGMGAIPGA